MKHVLCTILASMLLWPAAAAAAEPTPLVFAVDTSRSLRGPELAVVGGRVAEIAALLPADTPVGLIAFNDEATWLAPLGASAADLDRALAQLSPQGNYTVLHDALFLASRELQDGGVIVVITDGRDENSATTVDDVARLSEAQHVRVLTTGIGRVIDQRALRRLALVSRGEYLGAVETVEAKAVAELALSTAAAIRTEREQAQALVEPPPATTAQGEQPLAAATADDVDSRRGIPWWVILLAVAIVALGLLIGWLMLRGRSSQLMVEDRVCDRCGATLEAWETSCSRCELEELEEGAGRQQVAQQPQRVAASAIPDESVLDPAVFTKSPLPEGLDQTVVLDEQPVLITKERGKPPRTYALPRSEIFVVGRAKGVNTLQLDDPTVSGQHFKVVPKGDDFFVVDLGTTNGTSVNHERVKVRKLSPGDIIRVGMVEFEFRMKIRRLA